MRNRFDRELEVLNEELLQMGMLVEIAIEDSVKIIYNNDREKIEKVIEYEEKVDEMERKIQTHCLRLLIEQQPVASDLRKISAALKIITDMERIGDQARDIAEICMHRDEYGEKIDENTNALLKNMADSTIKMVNNTVKAFVDSDVKLARLVSDSDDEVDEYFVNIRADLVELIKTEKGEANFIIDVLMISKYLERIADHAVNISEWVIFMVEG